VAHVFLLFLYLGVADGRTLESDGMYFRDLPTCQWYAKELVRRWGYLSNPADFAVAYCVPRLVDVTKVPVY